MFPGDLSQLPGHHRTRHLATALLLLVCVILVGTAGFVWIEGWSPFRALYFTIITITTVGYGDEGLSDHGKAFAATLLVGGIGVASYALAVTVQIALVGQLAWKKLMQKEIDRLKEHTLVIGFGRMGRIIARELREKSSPFVVVTEDEGEFRDACDLGYTSVLGAPSADETLLRAGLEEAAHVVVVVGREPDAIVTVLSTRVLRPDVRIIARAESEEGLRKLRLAGADRIVSIYQAGGLEIASAIMRPDVADFVAYTSVEGADVALDEVVVEEGARIAGKTLLVYGRAEGSRLSFVAIQRPGKELVMRPPSSVRMQPGDLVLVAGEAREIARFRQLARAIRRRSRRRAA